MSENKDSKVFSLGGSAILHHAEPRAWSPPEGEMCLEQIAGHIERHLGPIAHVFHEVISDTVHIDVHVVRPTDENPFARLVTSGMSDLPMSTPQEIEPPRFAELIVTLPPDWKLDQASLEDDSWYWPVRLIKSLARFPHKYGTWAGATPCRTAIRRKPMRRTCNSTAASCRRR